MRSILVIFCLALLLLSGCVSLGTYHDLEAENEDLQAVNALRQSQVQTLIKDNIELQHQLDALKYEYETLQEEYDKVPNLREFESGWELGAWLEEDDTDTLPYIESTQDCDDFARILMTNAYQDGYIIGFYVIDDHAMNITFINGEIFLILPQLDDFWTMGYTWE